MVTARQSAIRVLQLMMVASIVLPAILFAFASWMNYRHYNEVADDRIERSLDILHEHTLKVFETVQRAAAEVDEVQRGLTEEDIRAQEERLHERLRLIVEAMPQLQAIVLIDRNGRRLASSIVYPAPDDLVAANRSYFTAQVEHDAGTFVSEVVEPRFSGNDVFFTLSRRRPSADGSFKRRHGDRGPPGLLRGVLRADRPQPPAASTPWRARTESFSPAILNAMTSDATSMPTRPLRREIAKGLDESIYTVNVADRPRQPAHRLPKASRLPDLRRRGH